LKKLSKSSTKNNALVNIFVHDWDEKCSFTNKNIQILDETLRDGLQAIHINYPSIEQKIEILDQINNLGIDIADIGFPATNQKRLSEIDLLIQHKVNNDLNVNLACAARSLEQDVIPIIELSQKHSIQLEALIFVGTSKIRHVIENWDKAFIDTNIKRSIEIAVKNNLRVCFVAEDATRTKPSDLLDFYKCGIEAGASSIAVCDTVGISTPNSILNMFKTLKPFFDKNNVNFDWHGHNDRGLALINALVAIEHGATRIHTTGLGIGERAGNVSTEELVANLAMYQLPSYQRKLNILNNYSKTISKYLNYSIPADFPFLGENVFSTQTGTHASAIVKSNDYDKSLNNIIYSSIDPSCFGREVLIELGNMSGLSNIKIWLKTNKFQINDKNISFVREFIDNEKFDLEELKKALSKQNSKL